jgi:DNA-binding Xre family transcriptional regulator
VTTKVSYHWHLRRLMAEADMFATSDLVPLLAERGVRLSREQVYRLVAHVPERLSLATLAALCDILGCGPSDLVEPYRAQPPRPARRTGTGADPVPRPTRARVLRGGTGGRDR